MTGVFPGLFVVLWSTGFIGSKLGLPYAEPATFLVLRFLLVLVILLPLCWLYQARWPSPRGAAHMVVAGIFLQAGYLGGVFASMAKGMPAGVSAPTTALMAWPLFGETYSLTAAAGLADPFPLYRRIQLTGSRLDWIDSMVLRGMQAMPVRVAG